MIIVFDLDDTLYDEINYVKSGFKAVSNFLSENFNINKNEAFNIMIYELDKNGRGKIFDVVLKKYKIYTVKNLKKCISLYRLHNPEITLTQETISCLERFHNYKKYIITDGNKIVQQKKIKALNIEKYFTFCFISRRYGIHNEKPSMYCFQKICELESTTPENIVYIGDNPAKDFVGIKPFGIKTIRIMKGNYRDIVKTIEYEAQIQINSLSELTSQLLNKIFV